MTPKPGHARLQGARRVLAICKQDLRLTAGNASLILLSSMRIVYLFLQLWHFS